MEPDCMFAPLPEGDTYHNQWEALTAWFLGPRGENADVMKNLVLQILESHVEYRRKHSPQDTSYITERIKHSDAYKAELEQTQEELQRILKELQKSIPFFSTRYRAHMNWDTTLPANLGYMAGLLYNQNNVASESSPVTSLMEREVGHQLCGMLGYHIGCNTQGGECPDPWAPRPWGHLTCGGTVANIEAAWAARNLKYFPLAVRNAVREEGSLLAKAAHYTVTVVRLGKQVPILEVEDWDLLNIPLDQAVSIGGEVAAMANIPLEQFNTVMKKYSLQSLGLTKFVASNKMKDTGVMLVPASCHYSWPKAATLLGLGDSSVIKIQLDADGRQNMTDLRRRLEECLEERIPVLMMVAVMGSTEEGAIDPLHDMIKLRTEFQHAGLNFCMHADAAWGGYMCTMLDRGEKYRITRTNTITRALSFNHSDDYILPSPLSKHSKLSLEAMAQADTITVDPHKTGLIPYPAGGLCYRNGLMKGFLTPSAPVNYLIGDHYSVGMFGLEGSKPGAAAVATLLSHRVIGLDTQGYGRIMAQCMTGAKMFYCLLLTLTDQEDPFICIPLKPLPHDWKQQEMKKFIQERIINQPYIRLINDPEAIKILTDIGPDTMVNSFCVNIRGNTQVSIVAKLTSLIFQRLSSISALHQCKTRIPLYLSMSSKDSAVGESNLNQYKTRLDIAPGPEPLPFLISSCLNPWETRSMDLAWMRSSLRQVILISVGQIQDPLLTHSFVTLRDRSCDSSLYCHYITDPAIQGKHYQAILKLELDRPKDRETISRECPHGPVFLTLQQPVCLPSLLLNTDTQVIVTVSQDQDIELCKVRIIVTDVILLWSLQDRSSKGRDVARYWLYGEDETAYISSLESGSNTQQQLARLRSLPEEMDIQLVRNGIKVKIDEVESGEKLERETQYTISYQGMDGWMMIGTVYLEEVWTKSRKQDIHQKEMTPEIEPKT